MISTEGTLYVHRLLGEIFSIVFFLEFESDMLTKFTKFTRFYSEACCLTMPSISHEKILRQIQELYERAPLWTAT